MQQYFPHDPRFNYKNFGNTPINVIFQALEYGQKFYKENLHCNELGIATLTSYFVNANKDPKKGSRVTPADFFFFRPDRSSDIKPDVATTFFSLLSDNLLPPWVVANAPIKELVNLRDRGNISKPRALIAKDVDVFVITPRLSFDLFCGFVVVWEVEIDKLNKIALFDVDNLDSNPFAVVQLDKPEHGDRLTLVYSNYYL